MTYQNPIEIDDCDDYRVFEDKTSCISSVTENKDGFHVPPKLPQSCIDADRQYESHPVMEKDRCKNQVFKKHDLLRKRREVWNEIEKVNEEAEQQRIQGKNLRYKENPSQQGVLVITPDEDSSDDRKVPHDVIEISENSDNKEVNEEDPVLSEPIISLRNTEIIDLVDCSDDEKSDSEDDCVLVNVFRPTVKKDEHEKINDVTDRTDITCRRVFSIDGERTRIREDAMHIEVLQEGVFEVGIHSVDCTNLLSFDKGGAISLMKMCQKGSNIEFVKRNDKVTMSLDVGKQRNTISLVMKCDQNGDIIEQPVLCQSFIASRGNLTFVQFENLLTRFPNPENCGYNFQNTQEFGRIWNTSIYQLKMDGQNLHDVVGFQFSKAKNELMMGERLVRDIGLFLGKYIGQYLVKVYNRYAFVKYYSGKPFATFRSPLRKLGDYFVLKQLVCAMHHMSWEQMAKDLIGGSLEDLRELIYTYRKYT
ncbi:hypothetical protein EIN_267400 [Entamoeba invadens IP1]|uniref:RNB domain-containing protein n=1 Tax=Entamoeba invadens IP1 TaxID=370355 RepID=A0A0A1U7W6_ENTIV|nr:hypothetical protein EIN_267400 [Entamoeba invadens IP1]ELP91024.1 hypothetical protein EIN_267400 [Entamoeba invadens IP1]|eukprot:XP_004257795.1 hypothetical protein EIN_267400 [Entamoeba invadens IP1]